MDTELNHYPTMNVPYSLTHYKLCSLHVMKVRYGKVDYKELSALRQLCYCVRADMTGGLPLCWRAEESLLDSPGTQ